MINSSPKRKTSDCQVGETVIVKNHTNKRKFDPYFGPVPHIISKDGAHGVTLQRSSDNALCKRHIDDIKPLTVQPTIPSYQYQQPQPEWVYTPTNTHPPQTPLPYQPPPSVPQQNLSPIIATTTASQAGSILQPNNLLQPCISPEISHESEISTPVSTTNCSPNIVQEPSSIENYQNIGDIVKTSKRKTKPINRYPNTQ